MTDKMEGFIIRLRRFISQIKYVPLTGGRIGKPPRDQMTSMYTGSMEPDTADGESSRSPQ